MAAYTDGLGFESAVGARKHSPFRCEDLVLVNKATFSPTPGC